MLLILMNKERPLIGTGCFRERLGIGRMMFVYSTSTVQVLDVTISTIFCIFSCPAELVIPDYWTSSLYSPYVSPKLFQMCLTALLHDCLLFFPANHVTPLSRAFLISLACYYFSLKTESLSYHKGLRWEKSFYWNIQWLEETCRSQSNE